MPGMPPPEPAPPPHVLAAFGIREAAPEPAALSGAPAWRCGEVLLRRVGDTVVAAWVAGMLDELRVEGLRLARPVPASDGRWVVAGWAACRELPGRPEPRHDEVVATSLRLHEALAGLGPATVPRRRP